MPGGLPALLKAVRNAFSISSEGVAAVIPSPRLIEYQVCILIFILPEPEQAPGHQKTEHGRKRETENRVMRLVDQ